MALSLRDLWPWKKKFRIGETERVEQATAAPGEQRDVDLEQIHEFLKTIKPDPRDN